MEVWKTIKGYEGKYLVSNKGDIMSCYTGKRMSFGKDKSGYYVASLYNDYGRKTLLVHRLVAHAFIEKPMGLNEINHINENKQDNRVENLEWVSHSENLKKYWKNHPEMHDKCCPKPSGIKKSYSYYAKKGTKYSKIKVVQFDLQDQQINVWENVATIHKVLGYNNTSIIECCKNQRHTAYGYKWQFAIDIQ